MRKLSSVLILGLIFAVFSLFRQWPDVAQVKTKFPIILYEGPQTPPKVHLQSKPPSGWVKLDEISQPARGAVLVSEDWAFYQHSGIDTQQIQEAIKESWESGRLSRGASTITQQVVRNVFLNKEKTLTRKLKEIFLSLYLEREVSKGKILETYFNIAEWGEGLFGIGAASQYYFQKKPSELTAKEGAFLAMLLPSPKRYSQSFRLRRLSEYARNTILSILEKMVKAHYLTEQELMNARTTALSFENLEPIQKFDIAPLPETE